MPRKSGWVTNVSVWWLHRRDQTRAQTRGQHITTHGPGARVSIYHWLRSSRSTRCLHHHHLASPVQHGNMMSARANIKPVCFALFQPHHWASLTVSSFSLLAGAELNSNLGTEYLLGHHHWTCSLPATVKINFQRSLVNTEVRGLEDDQLASKPE